MIEITINDVEEYARAERQRIHHVFDLIVIEAQRQRAEAIRRLEYGATKVALDLAAGQRAAKGEDLSN